MTPQEIKAKIQAAYTASLQNRAVMYGMRTSPLDHQFRDLKLYGRDAGADFADTNLGRIIDEAVAVAGRKQPSMELQVYGWGRAAIDGMAETLRHRTDLKVEISGSTVQLIWAEDNPALI
ncbi:hypothetical protein [Methylobacterium oryzae]|uniref:Protein of unassigned function n=1 Tax=Methylobacterium oryzae CBMB20 TaxID=693986 RepID=A0A089P111_9HYPH|nr:hypothetical protein [Methylobacterium oryzae]AIQ92445.1 protein of unassigned function [Methylobacterium oryzae CBMB20]